MPPPEDGNEYLPFVDMISLEAIDSVTYRSKALPFSPGGAGRAYGGHVYAQAVWAAAQKVKSGFVVHNVTGFFTLGGFTNIPFVYSVRTIRDGRSYCTRTVDVTQGDGHEICFTCTCSFKVAEDSPLDVQAEIDLDRQYAIAIKGKKPEDWEEAPGMDSPWYWQRLKEGRSNDPCPGLETRKADMTAYNAPLSPLDRRQLYFYRIIGTLPPDPNLHACAHLFASDRNSLFIVANHLDMAHCFEDGFHAQMASLSHTVVFHTPVPALMMTDPDTESKLWFCKEDWTTRAAGGRGIHNSRLIGPGGVHIASTWQEGMVRVNGKRHFAETRALKL